jgi:hypothetical protein
MEFLVLGVWFGLPPEADSVTLTSDNTGVIVAA